MKLIGVIGIPRVAANNDGHIINGGKKTPDTKSVITHGEEDDGS